MRKTVPSCSQVRIKRVKSISEIKITIDVILFMMHYSLAIIVISAFETESQREVLHVLFDDLSKRIRKKICCVYSA